MSAESSTWLNQNVLVGNTDKRGKAWHYSASAQGDEPNHYPGPIPVADVHRRLFSWEAQAVSLALVTDELVGIDEHGNPVTEPAFDRGPVEGWVAIRHSVTGKVFQVPTDGYVIHQYQDALMRDVETLTGEGLVVETAGILREGGRAFVQVALPNSIEVAGMELRPTLLSASSHDGSLSRTHKLVFGVVVCDNTLSMALVEPTPVVRFKHTRNSKARSEAALIADGLGLVESAAAKARKGLDKLATVPVSDAQFQAILAGVFKPSTESKNSVTIAERQRNEAMHLWTSDDERIIPVHGTALGVVQTLNTWRHHLQTVRGGERVERNWLAALGNSGLIFDRKVLDVTLAVTDVKHATVA